MGINENVVSKKKFKKIDELNVVNEDDEYKPQYLNPTDINVEMESPDK
jgi:hypothetical protein